MTDSPTTRKRAPKASPAATGSAGIDPATETPDIPTETLYADFTLARRIANVMEQVEPLEKTGVNEAFGFKFIPIEQMIRLLRPLLAEQGIVIIPQAQSAEYAEAGQTRSQNPITSCHLIVDWLITDGTEQMTATTAGEANDTSDKAANKAMTAAYKQLLAKTFMLAADADPDADHVERTNRAPRQSTPREPLQRCPIHGVDFLAWKTGGSGHKLEDGSWCRAADAFRHCQNFIAVGLERMQLAGGDPRAWLDEHFPELKDVSNKEWTLEQTGKVYALVQQIEGTRADEEGTAEETSADRIPETSTASGSDDAPW